MKNRLLVFSLLLTSAPLVAITPAQQQLTSRLVYLLLRGDQAQIEKLYKNPAPGFTQSDGHAFLHYKDIRSYFSKYGIYGTFWTLYQTTDAQRCFGALYQKELEENSAGRYTFVHGQQWAYEWTSSLYKILYEAATNTTTTNYQFLRFKRPNKLNQKKERELYQQLRNGNGFYHWRRTGWATKDSRLLWLNFALFGSNGNSGSCSAEYWIKGMDWSSKQIADEHIFNKFNLQNLYATYEKELEQLKKEHAALTKRGNLLLISLSPKYVAENITVSPETQYCCDTKTNIVSLLNTLKTNPSAVQNSNKLAFTLILTKDRTLKPSDDIRIFAFNGVTPAKWAAFCKKRTELFERIKKDAQILLRSK